MARILLVEDMQDALDACALILRMAGHTVFAVTSPTLAMQSYADQYHANLPFDLVILDLAMPGTNGFEVAAHIRALDQDARIVFLTAFDDPLSVGRAESSGALGYWSKPISAPALTQNVARVLETVECAPQQCPHPAFVPPAPKGYPRFAGEGTASTHRAEPNAS